LPVKDDYKVSGSGLEALSLLQGMFVNAWASASNIPLGCKTATTPTTNHNNPKAISIA